MDLPPLYLCVISETELTRKSVPEPLSCNPACSVPSESGAWSDRGNDGYAIFEGGLMYSKQSKLIRQFYTQTFSKLVFFFFFAKV